MNVLNVAINTKGTYPWNSKKNSKAINSVISPQESYGDELEKKPNKKVIGASVAGSLIGIMAAVGGVLAIAKRKNPAMSLKKLTYVEPDILMIGAGSVLGGLTGGIIADKNKENNKSKLREASRQFFGNILCPIGLLSATSKVLEKSGFKLPQINSSSRPAKIANGVLGALPKIAVTMVSLVGGMEIGNAVMNKVNNKIFKENKKHDVHLLDYLLHVDDLCLAANLLLKDAESISKVTSKILPFTFVIAGAKTGMHKADSPNH